MSDQDGLADLNDLQTRLIAIIKNKLPQGKSLGRELGDVLHLSSDSVYRRMRGETALTLNEIARISKHFEISMDEVIGMQNSGESVMFRYYRLQNRDYENYLKFILDEFTSSAKKKDARIIYSAKDIPIFYFFLFTELAIFKGYFYSKVLWPSEALKNEKFSFNKTSTKLGPTMETFQELGVALAKAYLKIPGVEIWNRNTLNGHLYQLQYMWEAGLFEDKESALLILDKTIELARHVQLQAERGMKMTNGESGKEEAPLECYFSEGILLENAIMREVKDERRCYLIHNVGDYLVSSDLGFCNRTANYLDNVLRKSSMVSKVGEKDRQRLIVGYTDDINRLKRMIESA